MNRLLFALTVAALGAVAQGAPEVPFRIAVVNEVTHGPVPGAGVTVSRESASIWGECGVDGTFAGTVGEPGEYVITVRRTGFRMTVEALGQSVEIKPGSPNEVTIAMLPLGTLTGRVLDQYGDPLRGAFVHIEDAMDVPGGGQEFESFAAAATDDLGEYRVAGIEPGAHFVAVEYSTADWNRTAGARSRVKWPVLSALLVYPNGLELETAQKVNIGAGETVRLADVHLKIGRSVMISGTVKPAPQRGLLSVKRVLSLALHSSPLVQAVEPDGEGRFQFEAPPGAYTLSASDRVDGRVSRPLKIEVGERDLTGLELEMGDGYSLAGRIVVDGPERLDFSAISLNFGGPPVKIDASGSFESNLSGPDGMYTIQGLPDGWYVATVQMGGKQISGKRFNVDFGRTDSVFTVSRHGAALSLRVEAPPGSLTPVIALLLPEDQEELNIESVPAGQASPDGSFRLEGIPPGTYRVLALDESNFVIAMSPPLLSKYRKSAPSITLGKGETRSLSIPMTKIGDK